MTGEALLSVKDLAIEFETSSGRVPALRGVSFDLKPGEVLGIVGESGAGKTVACRSIVRLLPSTARINSGHIWFRGRDMLALDEPELAKVRGEKIAMIFQNPSTHLDPLMPVGKQIGESIKYHFGTEPEQIRVQVIKLLESVRMPHPERWVDAYPHELSGGMRQRVMIAAALACRPGVLIADEPTTALDVTVQAAILRLLKLLRDERELSIILVSHDLAVIAETCDRVVVMKDGRVVETGSTTEIINRPKADYTKKLISSQPELMSRDRCVSTTSAADESVAQGRASDSHAILKIENLSVHFTQTSGFLDWVRRRTGEVVKAVDQLSIDVRQGETLGIVGESGSGKSTIARAIVRLVEPQAGRILFKASPVEEKDSEGIAKFRRAVQIVFQDPYTSLNPRFTVMQTLAEPLHKYGICPRSDIPERVRDLMKTVELPADLMHRRPSQLSGGQRQRVGIARALSLNPEVIIADEVTSSLDVTIQAQILDLLRKLRDSMNLTIIFISHDLGVVRSLCQTVAVMRRGQLVEYGPTEQIFQSPREAYTQQLLASIPHMTRVGDADRTISAAAKEEPSGSA